MFGEVLSEQSKLNVKKIEATGTSSGSIKYKSPATIVDCGTVSSESELQQLEAQA